MDAGMAWLPWVNVPGVSACPSALNSCQRGSPVDGAGHGTILSSLHGRPEASSGSQSGGMGSGNSEVRRAPIGAPARAELGWTGVQGDGEEAWPRSSTQEGAGLEDLGCCLDQRSPWKPRTLGLPCCRRPGALTRAGQAERQGGEALELDGPSSVVVLLYFLWS